MPMTSCVGLYKRPHSGLDLCSGQGRVRVTGRKEREHVLCDERGFGISRNTDVTWQVASCCNVLLIALMTEAAN